MKKIIFAILLIFVCSLPCYALSWDDIEQSIYNPIDSYSEGNSFTCSNYLELTGDYNKDKFKKLIILLKAAGYYNALKYGGKFLKYDIDEISNIATNIDRQCNRNRNLHIVNILANLEDGIDKNLVNKYTFKDISYIHDILHEDEKIISLQRVAWTNGVVHAFSDLARYEETGQFNFMHRSVNIISEIAYSLTEKLIVNANAIYNNRFDSELYKNLLIEFF